MDIPCMEEQQRLAIQKTCNRVRSSLTHLVIGIKSGNVNNHRLSLKIASGQLPFLGSMIKCPEVGNLQAASLFPWPAFFPGELGFEEIEQNSYF